MLHVAPAAPNGLREPTMSGCRRCWEEPRQREGLLGTAARTLTPVGPVVHESHSGYWARLDAPDDVDGWLLTWVPSRSARRVASTNTVIALVPS